MDASMNNPDSPQGTGGIDEVMALAAKSEGYGSDFAADTVTAYEALSQRVKFLEDSLEEQGDDQPAKKSMRIRVNASRTAKGYSVDATVEGTELVEQKWAEELEAQALARLGSLMDKLNAEYPKEAP